jgi:hypothetical protein
MSLESTQPLNRNEYQEFSWGLKDGRRLRLSNLTAVCEPIAQIMWEPRRLTTVWASRAYYRDNFTLLPYYYECKVR